MGMKHERELNDDTRGLGAAASYLMLLNAIFNIYDKGNAANGGWCSIIAELFVDGNDLSALSGPCFAQRSLPSVLFTYWSIFQDPIWSLPLDAPIPRWPLV